jgi:hypothetical protein
MTTPGFGAVIFTFAVPTGAILGDRQWRCGKKHWGTYDNPTFQCGCPTCLTELDLTLVWLPKDMKPEIALNQRRFRPCRLKLARLSPDQIVPGFREYLDGLSD